MSILRNIVMSLVVAVVLAGFAGCDSEEPPNANLLINSMQKLLSSKMFGQPDAYRVESAKRIWGKRTGDSYQMEVEFKIRVMKDTDCTLQKINGKLRNCGPGLKAGDFVYLETTREFTKINDRWHPK